MRYKAWCKLEYIEVWACCLMTDHLNLSGDADFGLVDTVKL